MARVVCTCLDPRAAGQLANIVATDGHEFQLAQKMMPIEDLLDSDVAFVGGGPEQYLPLLHRVRGQDSSLPFIVVARHPETEEWLDALGAGATDYCVPPFDARQVRWLIRAAVTTQMATAAIGKTSPGASQEATAGEFTSLREARIAENLFRVPDMATSMSRDGKESSRDGEA